MPQGCLIALGALHKDSSSGAICDDLRRRAENHTVLLQRLERGVAEGEVPAGFDKRRRSDLLWDDPSRHVDPGRDGASCDALMATGAGAMAAWQGLAGTT